VAGWTLGDDSCSLSDGEENHILIDENYLSPEECKYLVSLYEIFWSPDTNRATMVTE